MTAIRRKDRSVETRRAEDGLASKVEEGEVSLKLSWVTERPRFLLGNSGSI
jgi:hypothetical protein